MRRSYLFWGVILISFGSIFILDGINLLPGNPLEYLWQVFLIILGLGYWGYRKKIKPKIPPPKLKDIVNKETLKSVLAVLELLWRILKLFSPDNKRGWGFGKNPPGTS